MFGGQRAPIRVSGLAICVDLDESLGGGWFLQQVALTGSNVNRGLDQPFACQALHALLPGWRGFQGLLGGELLGVAHSSIGCLVDSPLRSQVSGVVSLLGWERHRVTGVQVHRRLHLTAFGQPQIILLKDGHSRWGESSIRTDQVVWRDGLLFTAPLGFVQGLVVQRQGGFTVLRQRARGLVIRVGQRGFHHKLMLLVFGVGEGGVSRVIILLLLDLLCLCSIKTFLIFHY